MALDVAQFAGPASVTDTAVAGGVESAVLAVVTYERFAAAHPLATRNAFAPMQTAVAPPVVGVAIMRALRPREVARSPVRLVRASAHAQVVTYPVAMFTHALGTVQTHPAVRAEAQAPKLVPLARSMP